MNPKEFNEGDLVRVLNANKHSKLHDMNSPHLPVLIPEEDILIFIGVFPRHPILDVFTVS